jgi:inosine/xanthosine triphosphate pyrophosphatase family protein
MPANTIQIALATGNKGKLDEFERMLEPYRIKLFRGPKIDSPEEDGINYYENARIKAANGAQK